MPFKEHYQCIPPHFYNDVRAYIQEMLDISAICKSHSLWASAVVLVWKWYVCSWLSTCSLKLLGMIMHLPFSIMPSITASSSLYDQYGCKSAHSSSLLSGQPVIIIPFSCCRWLSHDNACCISAIDTHSGISIAVCMASTQMSMPFIGLCFPSVWLCLNSLSAMKSQGQVCK